MFIETNKKNYLAKLTQQENRKSSKTSPQLKKYGDYISGGSFAMPNVYPFMAAIGYCDVEESLEEGLV